MIGSLNDGFQTSQVGFAGVLKYQCGQVAIIPKPKILLEDWGGVPFLNHHLG